MTFQTQLGNSHTWNVWFISAKECTDYKSSSCRQSIGCMLSHLSIWKCHTYMVIVSWSVVLISSFSLTASRMYWWVVTSGAVFCLWFSNVFFEDIFAPLWRNNRNFIRLSRCNIVSFNFAGMSPGLNLCSMLVWKNHVGNACHHQTAMFLEVKPCLHIVVQTFGTR